MKRVGKRLGWFDWADDVSGGGEVGYSVVEVRWKQADGLTEVWMEGGDI